jgi:hypothetical protein
LNSRNFCHQLKVAKLVTAEERFKKLLAKQAQQVGPQQGPRNGQKPWKDK